LGKFYEGLGNELSLYVKHLAWLNTAPKEPQQGKRKSKDAPPPPTRMARMKGDGIEPELPPCPAPHLIAHLMEVGPFEVTGMDRVTVSWREIDAWIERTGFAVAAWEVRLLRRLSNDYLSSSRAAEDPHCPAPWSAKPTQSNRDAIERKLLRVFG